MTHKPRIYQVLRRAGVIHTRDDAVRLLKAGKVLVDGKPVFTPHYQVSPKKQVVVDGEVLTLHPKRYFMLHKPAGFLTTIKKDPLRRHVMELIVVDDSIKKTLFPVGRLDFQTSGLLVITNDGNLAHRILRPENKIEKEYVVKIDTPLTKKEVAALEQGVDILVDEKSYRTKPAIVKPLGHHLISLTVAEGKKRQVRLMVAAVGREVIALKRVRIGGLVLGDLEEGEIREISKANLQQALFGLHA